MEKEEYFEKYFHHEDNLKEQKVKDIYGYIFELSHNYNLKIGTLCQFDHIYKKYLSIANRWSEAGHLYLTALISLRIAIKFDETRSEIDGETLYYDLMEKMFTILAMYAPELEPTYDNLCEFIQHVES